MKKIIFCIIRCALWAVTYVGSLPTPLTELRDVLMEGRPDLEDWMYNISVGFGCFVIYLVWLVFFSIPFIGIRKLWHTLHVDVITMLIVCLLNSASYCVYRQILY